MPISGKKAFRALEFCLLFHPYTFFFAKDLAMSKLQRKLFQKKFSNYKNDDIDKLAMQSACLYS